MLTYGCPKKLLLSLELINKIKNKECFPIFIFKQNKVGLSMYEWIVYIPIV